MRINIYIYGLILTALITSCSNFNKLQKTADIQKKYDGAMAYFDKQDYYRAGILLEELIPLLRGREESEIAQFRYAYCHYRQRQLALSAYYFKNFYETFPRSEKVEEAAFMYAASLYEDTPAFNLDQTNSYEAIDALQSFILRFPQSERVEKCNTMIDVLQQKLEKKDYENAKLYLKLGDYKAAIIAFDNFRKDFPDSQYNEEIAFRKVEALYLLARVSTDTKKEERYKELLLLHQRFADMYPSSNYIKESENYYDIALQYLKAIHKKSSL